MAYDNLLFEVKNQIARLTLNRPQVLNAREFENAG